MYGVLRVRTYSPPQPPPHALGRGDLVTVFLESVIQSFLGKKRQTSYLIGEISCIRDWGEGIASTFLLGANLSVETMCSALCWRDLGWSHTACENFSIRNSTYWKQHARVQYLSFIKYWFIKIDILGLVWFGFFFKLSPSYTSFGFCFLCFFPQPYRGIIAV